MRERLWKISQRFTCVRLDLFRKKIQLVRVTEGGLENFVRFRQFSATRQKIHFPETANGKRAFMPTFTLLVAVNETAARHESFPNPCIGLLHPGRAGRLETMVRQKQRRRVHDTAAASLRIPGDLRVPSALLDLVANVLPLGGTSCGVESSNLTERVHLQQSIERHPAHQP